MQIFTGDALKVIRRFDTPDTLFYCDPPYVLDTRKGKGDYCFEMTNKQHRAFLDCVLSSHGKFIISGYANDLYRAFEDAGFKRVDIETVCFAAGRTRFTGIQGKGAALEKQARTESLWLSPGIQEALP